MTVKLTRTVKTTRRWQRRRALLGLGVAALTIQAFTPPSTAADTKPSPGEPLTITADDLPTWQTDGVVWSITTVGDVVYVGGNFDFIRPPGTNPGDPQQLARKNLAAFNAATGEPLPWNPTVDGTPFTDPNPQNECDDLGNNQWNCDAVWEVKASPDGSRLYVGGDFSHINGQRRAKIAAFDLPSGTLNTFKREINSRVKALTVTDTTVYAGGFFTAVDGTPRQRLAAFTTSDGALAAWAPTADRGVHALITSPDHSRIVIGGNFNRINDTPPHGLGAVYADTGHSAPWETGVEYYDDVRRSWVTDLVKDGDTIYASANGEGTFDGRLALNPDDGTMRWIDNCLGATQAITLMRSLSESYCIFRSRSMPGQGLGCSSRRIEGTSNAACLQNGRDQSLPERLAPRIRRTNGIAEPTAGRHQRVLHLLRTPSGRRRNYEARRQVQYQQGALAIP
ncbi:hypothetical protein [Actinomadura sp. 6N118]|uniref:hypothetical protein n=1 Tax=Actinomadura sp. 6N118 TaxID=3375151 RepID=UPI00378EB675